jgi:hypothetical protein
MKKLEIQKFNIELTFKNKSNILSKDAMKAFHKKVSANINIMTYLRGDEIIENAVPFDAFSHIIEG